MLTAAVTLTHACACVRAYTNRYEDFVATPEGSLLYKCVEMKYLFEALLEQVSGWMGGWVGRWTGG